MPSLLRLAAPLALAVLAACSDVSAPTEPEAPTPELFFGGYRVVSLATGAGAYDQPLPASLGGGSTSIGFLLTTLLHQNGGASGWFRHSGTIQDHAVDFEGVVTCAAVDPVLKRAWIGGVITRNRSTHPSFTGAINQVGKDIWFRVADMGNGHNGPDDRSTFVGFEGGGGIITSAQYCDARIWPNNANPVTRGNLVVK